jgi:hypothetical protein
MSLALKIKDAFDRITLALAVICGLIGFFFGMAFTEKNYSTENPEFIEWKQKYEDRKDDLRDKDFKTELERINSPDFGKPGSICFLKDYLEYDPRLSELRQQRPSMYSKPPMWKFILGALTGLTGFFVTSYVCIWCFVRLTTNILRALGGKEERP